MVRTRIVSSLEKCFLDTPPETFEAMQEERIFQNQRYSFQLLPAIWRSGSPFCLRSRPGN